MRPTIKGSVILVTGGAGFIGSNLVDSLLDNGAKQIIVIDNMFVGKKENLSDALAKSSVLYIDDAEIYSSLDYIFTKHDIDIVFNCATKALNYSFINPANAFMTNVNVLQNLLELQRKGAYRTLCHFSSSEVYGTAVYEPMDEDHPRLPTTTYAAGKAAADLLLHSYVEMFDLDSFIVRPFNNYGPRQNYEGPLTGVIPATIFKILNGEAPEIHGTGMQTRDFIYVEDTVDAIIKLFPVMLAGDSVNISTKGQITIKELIEKVVFMMGFTGPIIYKESRGADVMCHNSSNKKLKGMIELQITDLDSGLRKTIDWYINILRNSRG